MKNETLLLLTDFSYQAKGREYFREDVEVSCFLRRYFRVCIAHIKDIEKIIAQADVILIRNTGPQRAHAEELKALRRRPCLRLFNDLQGRGDLEGKFHLLELFRSGFPVIPTFESKEELEKFGVFETCLLKPLERVS